MPVFSILSLQYGWLETQGSCCWIWKIRWEDQINTFKEDSALVPWNQTVKKATVETTMYSCESLCLPLPLFSSHDESYNLRTQRSKSRTALISPQYAAVAPPPYAAAARSDRSQRTREVKSHLKKHEKDSHTSVLQSEWCSSLGVKRFPFVWGEMITGDIAPLKRKKKEREGFRLKSAALQSSEERFLNSSMWNELVRNKLAVF